MAAKTAFENGRISDLERLVTLTMDWVILHTFVHYSSTSTLPTWKISFKSNKHFVDGRRYVRTYVRMDGHLRPALSGQLCQRVDLKMVRFGVVWDHSKSLKITPFDRAHTSSY